MNTAQMRVEFEVLFTSPLVLTPDWNMIRVDWSLIDVRIGVAKHKNDMIWFPGEHSKAPGTIESTAGTADYVLWSNVIQISPLPQ